MRKTDVCILHPHFLEHLLILFTLISTIFYDVFLLRPTLIRCTRLPFLLRHLPPIRSDPDKDIIGWGENDRGVSFTFGEDIVAQFLRRHDLDLICRAHQVQRLKHACTCIGVSRFER